MIYSPWELMGRPPAMNDTHFDIENSSSQKYRRRLPNFWLVLDIAGGYGSFAA
jgi:hypothetical protein